MFSRFFSKKTRRAEKAIVSKKRKVNTVKKELKRVNIEEFFNQEDRKITQQERLEIKRRIEEVIEELEKG